MRRFLEELLAILLAVLVGLLIGLSIRLFRDVVGRCHWLRAPIIVAAPSV